MDLYKILHNDVAALIHYGASVYAGTAKDVFKVFDKRLEMVVNVRTGRIITVYRRN